MKLRSKLVLQVETLISNVERKENLLEDLKLFNSARRDDDGTAIQAFVADCMNQVGKVPRSRFTYDFILL